jgi:hypothetical protein
MDSSLLQIGQILRYMREKDAGPEMVGGFLNYWHLTHLDGVSRPLLEKGINPIAPVLSISGLRGPPY